MRPLLLTSLPLAAVLCVSGCGGHAFSSLGQGGDGGGPDSNVDGSAGGVAFVQEVVALGNQTVASVNATLPGVQAGDLLVVGAYVRDPTASIVSVSDTLGGSWKSTSAEANAGCGIYSDMGQIWDATSVAGDDTITVTQSGMNQMGFLATEYSGLGTSAHLGGSASALAMQSGAAMTGGMLHTTSADGLVVAMFSDGMPPGQMTAGAGYTTRATDGAFVAIMEDDLPDPGSAGTIVPGASLAGNGDACWVGVAAAFAR